MPDPYKIIVCSRCRVQLSGMDDNEPAHPQPYCFDPKAEPPLFEDVEIEVVPAEATVQSLFDGLDRWGAAAATLIPRDENDVALRAVIAVQGQPETDEILEAVKRVEDSWDDDEAATSES